MSSELILHHYANSPFSEKVRLVLGFKGLSWRAVDVPKLLPKPDAIALTGGYRRTPFLQIGADIYCDTALICRVLDALHPEPPLYPESTAGLSEILAEWADTALFWAAVPFTLQPAGLPHIMAGMTPEILKAFGADRASMSPNRRRATLADGGAQLHAYLARIEHLLADGRPFLLGALPGIADFAAAQSIWFIRLAPPVATLLEAYPRVLHWHAQVEAFGQGRATPMSSTEAIELARAAQGRSAPTTFRAETGLDEGDEVSVTPTDYAHDPVTGRLVGLGPHEVVIARTDARAGAVHVHFPRIAFQIKPTAAAK
ncbi:MAG TPA: glutathione S-transferase family protein [Burkholderiaceae bacterium]